MTTKVEIADPAVGLTSTEALDIIESIIRESPGLTNPVGKFGVCVYEKPEPSPGEAQRCLVGELFHRLGLTVPQGEGLGNVGRVVSKFEDIRDALAPLTVAMLASVQAAADSATERGFVWGTLLPDIEALRTRERVGAGLDSRPGVW